MQSLPIGYNAVMDADQQRAAELEAYAEQLRQQIKDHEALIQAAKQHLAEVAEHLRRIRSAHPKP
jgi:hypothetical protein